MLTLDRNLYMSLRYVSKIAETYTQLGLCLVAVTLAGCAGTVTPTPLTHSQPSNSGSAPTSGVLGIVRDKNGVVTGRLVDQEWVDYYNGLIAKRGKEFIPPMAQNDGVSSEGNGTYFVDRQHVVRFDIMNAEESGALK